MVNTAKRHHGPIICVYAENSSWSKVMQLGICARAVANAAQFVTAQTAVNWQCQRINSVPKQSCVPNPIAVHKTLRANNSNHSVTVLGFNALQLPIVRVVTPVQAVVIAMAWSIHVMATYVSLHVPAPGLNGLLTCAG